MREGRGNLSKAILVVVGRFTADVEARLARDYTLRRVASDSPSAVEELLRAAEGADAVFMAPVKLDAEFFRVVAGSVEVIATFSVGTITLMWGRRRHGGLRLRILRACWTMLRRTWRFCCCWGLRGGLMRRRSWCVRERGLGLGLRGCWDGSCAGKVLGIFGMGRIGQAVGRRARALGMKIHYSNRAALPLELAGDAVFHARAQDLLRVSQFLSLHAPHTPETHHF